MIKPKTPKMVPKTARGDARFEKISRGGILVVGFVWILFKAIRDPSIVVPLHTARCAPATF
jgi:hypothetical protein